MIKLGDKVKDKLTGFNGVAVARAEYLYGCIWVCVIPCKLQEGKPVEDIWFDEERLKIITNKPKNEDLFDKPMRGGPTMKMPKRNFPNPGKH
jgi:hypothetical protein